MSQSNGSGTISDIDLHAEGALDAVLAQLLASQSRVPVRKDPPWVRPRSAPGTNPVKLGEIPDALAIGEVGEDFLGHVDEAGFHTPEALTAQYNKSIAVARFVHNAVLNAITEGGEKGVSASDLYWAFKDSGYEDDFGAHLGTIVGDLSFVGLVNYNPTLTTDQQIVAIGEVAEIEWVGCMSFTGERNYPGDA